MSHLEVGNFCLVIISWYSWEGGVDKLKNKNLPSEKQFLVSYLIFIIVIINFFQLDNKKCSMFKKNQGYIR
jgi:hypothetical protein